MSEPSNDPRQSGFIFQDLRGRRWPRLRRVLAMLADTAGGFAAFLAAPVGARVVTIEMKINFLEAVEHGEIKADARVLRQGRSTSVVDCDVRDEDQRLVSKALMTFAIISPKKNQ